MEWTAAGGVGLEVAGGFECGDNMSFANTLCGGRGYGRAAVGPAEKFSHASVRASATHLHLWS